MSVVVTVVYGVALVLGGKLLLAAVGFTLLVGLGEWLTHLTWRRLPASHCAELNNPLARRFRRTAIRGTPVGSVRAPLSRERCAWYRVKVIQTIEHHDYPDVYVDLWTHQSDSTLGIQDSSGMVLLAIELVDRELRQVGAAESVTKRPWKGARRSGVIKLEALGLIPAGTYSKQRRSDIWVEETIVPSHGPITAVGVPRRRGGAVVLTKPRRGIAGVSTLTIEELRQRAAKESGENWSMTRAMFWIGLALSAFGWIIYFALNGLNLR